jgi:hypothetical protein
MSDVKEGAAGNLDPAQAIELAQLVELEARWENMRKTPSRAPEAGSATQALVSVQKAYDAFRSKLAAYNKRYTPAHVPELLLNTPIRLGIWCRAMRDLYRQVEHNPQIHCPVHLVEKANRWAERMSVRMHKNCVSRLAPPETMGAAIEILGALVQWCNELTCSAEQPAA